MTAEKDPISPGPGPAAGERRISRDQKEEPDPTSAPRHPAHADTESESDSSSDAGYRVPSAVFDERVSNEPLPDVGKYPDGGPDAWLTVAGGMCGLFTSFGWTNCAGVFQAYYQTHQLKEYSPSTIAWIPGLMGAMIYISGPIVGRVFDNHGPRHILLLGSFLHVFGIMMTSISTEYYQIVLSQGICSPLGSSMILYPCFSCVATWFERRRAVAMGITAAGSSIAGVVLPLMVDRLMPRIGFGWTMRACAFIFLGLLVFVNVAVKSRIPPQPKGFAFMSFVRPFGDPEFVLTATASFFFAMGIFVVITFLIAYGAYIDMAPLMASALASVFNAGSALGRVSMGWAADRLGNFNLSLAAAALTGVMILALWMPTRQEQAAFAFAALFGYNSGAFTSLTPAIVAQISDIREVGSRTGSMNLFVALASLVGGPIGGALVTANGGEYYKLQAFSAAMLLAGSGFYVAARMHLTSGKVWVKI